jgi:hypothetical protein
MQEHIKRKISSRGSLQGERKGRWSQLSTKETILQYAITKVSKAKLIPFL